MKSRVSGTFEVWLTQQSVHEAAAGSPLGRMSIEKQFHGELDATSRGEMLAAGTAVKGSAGYVAIEQLTGSLQGRRGSFMLQHSGTMTRGVPTLTVTVIPDSGTDELVGLYGVMTINIEEGQHFYSFEYSFEAAV
jgi:hypothetical protein